MPINYDIEYPKLQKKINELNAKKAIEVADLKSRIEQLEQEVECDEQRVIDGMELLAQADSQIEQLEAIVDQVKKIKAAGHWRRVPKQYGNINRYCTAPMKESAENDAALWAELDKLLEYAVEAWNDAPRVYQQGEK